DNPNDHQQFDEGERRSISSGETTTLHRVASAKRRRARVVMCRTMHLIILANHPNRFRSCAIVLPNRAAAQSLQDERRVGKVLPPMPKHLAMLIVALALTKSGLADDQGHRLASPNGRLMLDFQLVDGIPVYELRRDDKLVLRRSRIGLVRDDEDFSK